MDQKHTRGETHGCIVCGKLYELYVVYDEHGKFVDSKVMSAGGKTVSGAGRPLVACERHSQKEIERAIQRVYGTQYREDD